MNPNHGNPGIFGHHRVLLVLLLFIPLCIGALWYVSGNKQQVELSVTSNLPAEILEQRFHELISSLDSLSSDELARRTRDMQKSGLTDNQWMSARPVHFQTPGATLFRMPVPAHLSVDFAGQLLADIVLPDSSTEELPLEVDPAVIYRDAEFDGNQVARTWLGKDQSSLYMQETDLEHHLCLIKLNRSQLRFEPTIVNGASTGSRIVYSFTVHHEGLRRFYGKFLERECEELAHSRLEWFCQQLESIR